MGYVYLITNTLNCKKYVGQSKRSDINERWNQHKKIKKHSIGRYIYSAYKKYGIENFKFQIICVCFDEDCDTFEEEYIKKYNTISPNGYNIRSGGNSSSLHPETKELMSKRIKESFTPESRQKISDRHSGVNNFFYGIKKTDKEKEILSESSKNYWKSLSKDDKKKISDKRLNTLKEKYINTPHIISELALSNLKKNSDANKKSVGKYDKNNNLLEIYDSITSAALSVDTTYRVISNVCKNVKYCKTAKGFIWKFM